MWNWRTGTGLAGALALAAGLLLVPAGPLDVTAPLVACVVALGLWATWPASRRRVPYASFAVGLVSLIVTGIIALTPVPAIAEPEFNASLWMLLEPAVMVLFVYLPVRWSPPRLTVLGAGAAGLAVALSVQRYMPPSTVWWELFAGSTLWLLPSLAAGTIAWYLRSLDVQRDRAIADARQAQRLDLASDLHDFVAHDVSEIVAQAQASRMVLAVGNPLLEQALERIENAGLRALASMDRTVHMLRDSQSARTPIGGLADLPELVERFDVGGSTRARLTLADSLDAPREAGAVAYRVVVEALTNVRRHAPHASTVDVTIDMEGSDLRVRVSDDGGGDPRPGTREGAGLGIPGLTERVESLGGSLTAGPLQSRGWSVLARIPLSIHED